MPELPEAEITKRRLGPLRGKTAAGFWSDWKRGLRTTQDAKKIARDIKGRKILKIWRRGKVIFFDLSGTRVLALHQRMSGSLIIKSKIKNKKAKMSGHIHAKILFTNGIELWFQDPRKFGLVWYGQRKKVFGDRYLAALGPDALGISLKDFSARLKKHKGMLKPLLLRQVVTAGIGNIVADETLWRAKIHPKAKIENLGKKALKKVHSALEIVLKNAIAAQGTTLRDWRQPGGQAGRFQDYMKVYGRKGEQCFRCKSQIVRIIVGGRGTWFCVNCQQHKKSKGED